MAIPSLEPTFDEVSALGVEDIQISDASIEKLMTAVTESAFKGSGAGSYLSTWQMVTSQFDRVGWNPMIPNHEKPGMTFFTRPKLNLMGSNLRLDRVMSTLDTFNSGQYYYNTFPFSIRCYLDSNFARWSAIRDATTRSALINSDTPFIVPLSNQLRSIQGWPDFEVAHETLYSGFYGEDQSHARSSDFGNRTVDLTCTFGDFQGGYITALFLYYLRFMALVARGDLEAYQEDIDARRLCYTMSIYRFILDPSKRFIVKWAKATGCFPYNLPIGKSFDITTKEAYITASQEISISFAANHIEYMDPIIFQDFNMIVKEWAGGDPMDGRQQSLLTTGEDNFRGIPYIDTVSGSNELLWYAAPEEFVDPAYDAINNIGSEIMSKLNAYSNGVARASGDVSL